MKNITAILFCGGRGTRLYPVTDYYQKVMMPLGDEGKPMLEFVIEWLSSYGINNFVALIRYRANQIRRYFGDGSNWGVSIDYVLDDPAYKGTGGALLNAKGNIKTDEMLIYYTDILSNFNIKAMIDYHLDHGKIGTNLLDKNWKVTEGVVKLNEKNNIHSLDTQPEREIYANTGISMLNRGCFDYLEKLATKENNPMNIDLSGDLFPILALERQIKAYFMEEWWLDVGSLTRHQLINQHLLDMKFGGENP